MSLIPRIFSFFGIVLSQKESQKIFISWALKFVLHISTMLGFTIIFALFIGEFGVRHLPELFGIESLFSILGTFAFASFFKNFSKKTTLFIGVVILFFLSLLGFFLIETNIFLFFGILIFGYSVIVTQLNIIFSLFVEELFSPLESERAFPLIESAEPVGGIFAGLITGLGVSFLLPKYFILAWGIVTLFLIPILIVAIRKLERVPKPHSQEDHIERESFIGEFKNNLSLVSRNPFLKTLFVLVFVQWLVFNLIEFQYSSSAVEMFSHGSEHSSSDVVSQELAHGLGVVHIVLYGLLLIFQLLFASKIQKHLGVVKTIFLHPLMVFISATLMALKFSFFSTVLTKGAFEIFGGPSRNAYHSSFYVFRPHIRDRAKELLEGVARPLGMLVGTLFILAIQGVVMYFSLPILAMNSIISFLILILIGSRYLNSSKAEEKYTLLAKKNLETRGRAQEKLDAIQILSQKGHKKAYHSLLKVLRMKNEKSEIKIQILRTLGELRDHNAIPEILNCFNHSEKNIQIAALESLAKYKNLGDHFLTQSFAKYRVIEVLQNIFFESKSKSLKRLVIEVFQNIRHPDIIPFILNALNSKDDETVLGAIKVCGMFEDISSAHYLEPFLEHKNLKIKAGAIIAMWKFKEYRLRLTVLISSLFESNDTKSIETAVYIIGEIKGIHEFKRLLRILRETNDVHIQKHIYVALAKMEHSIAVKEIVNMLLHKNKDFSSSVRKLIFAPSVSKNIKKVVRHYLEQNVADKINSILKKEGEEILEKMKISTLQKLFDAYEIIGEYKEMLKISEILEKKIKEKKMQKNDKKDTGIFGGNSSILNNGKEISFEDLL